MANSKQSTPVIGGVDTHKDFHVAAVVDDNDQVLGTQSFATTRQGYKLMLTWMRRSETCNGLGSNAPAAMARVFCDICRSLV
ncbi:MAG: hypothetical protein ACI96M_000742 [Candidatus Azotimanducaceae bacterium]|jgi:hypothetical protein